MLQKVKSFIPLSRPNISEKTIDAVAGVLRSGWLATGPKTQEFEQSLSEYFGGRAVATLTSNTVGLQTSLMAIGVDRGDEVITTPLTFAATANTVASMGARPVFVDVGDDFNIDISKIEEVITDKTKAIMPVHYAGVPVDLDGLYDLAQKYNLRIIEDAAHAMGSTYKGKRIGSMGDIQVFSFHPIKNMTTGEGGCVVMNVDKADELYRVHLQRFHGIDRSIWARFSSSANCHYDVVFPGSKSNMSDIQAVIGLHQLEELEDMNEKRRVLIENYRKELSCLEEHIILPPIPSYEFVHSGHLFSICVRQPEKRDALMQFLREKQIGSTPYYIPLHLFSYYQKTFGYKRGDFPKAEFIGDRVVCIPLYPTLTESEQGYVIENIKDFFNAKYM